MMTEIFHRGPIACGIDVNPLLNYESGIINTKGEGIDPVISVTDVLYRIGALWAKM